MAEATAGPRYGAGLEEEILRGFAGELRPQPVRWKYRLGVLATAVTLLILPLVYVAMIVGTAAAAVLYAQLVWPRLSLPLPIVFPVLALAPPCAAAILVVFMIWSLFPHRQPQGRPIALTRSREPVLFAFVDRLCAALGAPIPRAIYVDLQDNASVHFRRGLIGMLRRDLVLTFGMPLAACLSLESFAGILAHELGHFTQGGGMSVSYLVRSLDAWLEGVATERHPLDEVLAISHRGRRRWFGRAVAALSRALLSLSRRLLWWLMLAGHAMTSFLMRQMELEADLCQARLVGSSVFQQTTADLAVLAAAQRRSFDELGEQWREGRLADNLPALVAANFLCLRPQLAPQREGPTAAAKSGIFDSHPSTGERLANARRADAPGVFRSPLPATAVFRNFPALGRSVSAGFYRRRLGPHFSEDLLFASEVVETRKQREEQEDSSFRRYFANAISPLRRLPLNESQPMRRRGPEAMRALRLARAEVESGQAVAALEVRRWRSAEVQATKAFVAGTLLRTGIELAPERFQLAAATREAAWRKQEQAVARMQDLTPRLAHFEQAVSRRLSAALALRDAPEIASRLEGTSTSSLEKRYAILCQLARPLDRVVAMLRAHALLGELLASTRTGLTAENAARLRSTICDTAEDIYQELSGLRSSLYLVAYPFEHARQSLSMAEFAIPDLPPAHLDVGGVYDAAELAIDAVFTVQHRLLAGFAYLAEQIELAAGLPGPGVAHPSLRGAPGIRDVPGQPTG